MRELQTIDLPAGEIRFDVTGDGPPIVFVHGFMVSGRLWRKVTPLLSDRFRCITPDWPFGSHAVPMRPDADLAPPGLARIVDDFLAAFDLTDVTLVGNDTGGAVCQLVAAHHPKRVSRLVLTPSDAFETFPPSPFTMLRPVSKIPGAVWLIAQTLRAKPLRRLPLTYGWVAKRPIPHDVLDDFVGPLIAEPGVRRDVAKVLAGLDRRHTLEAAERLGSFDRPALLVWASEDRLFPVSLAERLASVLPDARLEIVDDAYTFVPEDRPERLAELIGGFAS